MCCGAEEAMRRRREWAALELRLTLKSKPYARDFGGLGPPPVFSADPSEGGVATAEIYRRAMARQPSIFDPPETA